MKLNARDIATIYAASTFASVSTGLVGSYIWQSLGGVRVDYGLVTASTWFLVVGLPSVTVSGATLRRKLGEMTGTQVTAIAARNTGRKIPVSSNGKQSHLFMSVAPVFQRATLRNNEPAMPCQFIATLQGVEYTVLQGELEEFLYATWRRQRAGKPAMSRNYWTRQRRPRLRTVEYNARIAILQSIDGLILDRSRARSGRLSLPPQLAMHQVKKLYELD